MSNHQYCKYTPDMSSTSFMNYLHKMNNTQSRKDVSVSVDANARAGTINTDPTSTFGASKNHPSKTRVIAEFLSRWCQKIKLGETHIVQLEPWCESTKSIISSIETDGGGVAHNVLVADVGESIRDCRYLSVGFGEILDMYIGENLRKSTRNTSMPLCIDGENCCGKTTLLENSGLNNTKVNEYYNFTSHNTMPFQSMEYMILTDALYFGNNYAAIIDRSPISNLAFQFAMYLRNRHFEQMEANTKFSSFKMCEDYVEMHNLQALLEYINAKNYNVLILIDSDERRVANRMLYRGKKYGQDSDLTKCSDLLYHRAQCIAFAYLAMRLDYCVIDLNYLRELFRLSPKFVNHSDTNLDLMIFDLFKKYMNKYVQDKMIANKNTPAKVVKFQTTPYNMDNDFEANYIMAMSLSTR